MSALRNSKHEHFAHLIAKGGNPRQSYIDAGYSDKGADQSASRLLRNAEIAARVEEIKGAVIERAIEKTGIDKAWVLQQLVENVRLAKALEPVVASDGSTTGELKANLPAANQALTLIGKELGMFVDRKEVRTGTIEQMDDQQLEAMVRAKAKEAGISLH